MKLYYLKAADEATFNQALVDCGWAWDTEYVVTTDEDGTTTTTEEVAREAGVDAYTVEHSLDVIGVINMPTGNTLTTDPDEDGNTFEYDEMAPLDGWHANLLMHNNAGDEVPAELAGFVIEAPTNPVRKFA